MHLLCRIDKAIYSLVEREIQSSDVVITDERIEHIKERHP